MSFRRVFALALVLGATVAALAGCSKSTSTTAPAVLANTPPAAPTNLVGLYDASAQRDYLIWTPSTSASVVSYQVWQYSGDPSVGNTGKLVGTAASTASFTALPTPDQNVAYFYRMRSLDASSTAGAFSATIRVQRHGAVVSPGEGNIGGTKDPGVVISD